MAPVGAVLRLRPGKHQGLGGEPKPTLHPCELAGEVFVPGDEIHRNLPADGVAREVQHRGVRQPGFDERLERGPRRRHQEAKVVVGDDLVPGVPLDAPRVVGRPHVLAHDGPDLGGRHVGVEATAAIGIEIVLWRPAAEPAPEGLVL